MNDVLITVAKELPSAVALIVMVWMFLSNDEKRELKRIENAKQLEQERRAHELAINNMWAVNIKSMMEQQSAGNQKIADALSAHEAASRERYERMGITKDLVEAAKDKKQR